MAVILEPRPLRLTPAEQHYVQSKRTLRVGIDHDFKPLQFVDDDNVPAGMTVDYLRLLARHTGLELDFVPATWNGIIKMLKRGTVDLIADATPTPERREHFLFTRAVNIHTSSLYVLSNLQHIESLVDLTGKRVAVIKGTSVVNELRNYPDITLVAYDETIDQLRALQQGDVEGAVSYDTLSQFLFAHENISGIKAVGAIKSEPGCLAVRKQDTLLYSILSKAIESIPHEDIRNIEQKWVGVPAMERNYLALIHRYRHWGTLRWQFCFRSFSGIYSCSGVSGNRSGIWNPAANAISPYSTPPRT